MRLATKDENPNVPYGPEEIARDAVACARAGASIIHFHARDPETGAQLWHGFEAYTEAIRQIRSECDAIDLPDLSARTNEGGANPDGASPG